MIKYTKSPEIHLEICVRHAHNSKHCSHKQAVAATVQPSYWTHPAGKNKITEIVLLLGFTHSYLPQLLNLSSFHWGKQFTRLRFKNPPSKVYIHKDFIFLRHEKMSLKFGNADEPNHICEHYQKLKGNRRKITIPLLLPLLSRAPQDFSFTS